MQSNNNAVITTGLVFSTLDYTIFGLMLIISTAIGIYFGFLSKKKQDNTMEYLLGSKQMKVLPIAISVTATQISAITLLGVPSEIYRYGTQYWASLISGVVVTVMMIFFYLPVLHELQTTTLYTYILKRFDNRTRKIASALFTFSCILNIPIVVYAPAIAFSQVTQLNLHLITPIMCIICIFYTTFGGVRAVVWTDTLQFCSMMIALAAVIVLATISLGGFSNVFEIANRGERLILFNMDTDPFVRSTFWTISIGLTSMWISINGVTPEAVQRFLAVPNIRESKKVVILYGIGHTLLKYLSIYNGLLIFAKYEICDPITIGKVKAPDQIFPYFVMDIAKRIPGLPGLFVAGIFSAALSTMSSSLNTLSGTIYTDFLKPWLTNVKDKTASNIMKMIVLMIGIICLGLVFVVEKVGNLFSLAISTAGVTSGTLLGLFTLGMAFPQANKHGAFYGSIASLLAVSFIAIGAQLASANGNLKYQSLKFRTDGCEANTTILPEFEGLNSTIHIFNENVDSSQVFWLFKISFMYYSLIGTLIVFIVGYPVSLLTGGCQNLDEKLLWPLMRKKHHKNSGSRVHKHNTDDSNINTNSL